MTVEFIKRNTPCPELRKLQTNVHARCVSLETHEFSKHTPRVLMYARVTFIHILVLHFPFLFLSLTLYNPCRTLISDEIKFNVINSDQIQYKRFITHTDASNTRFDFLSSIYYFVLSFDIFIYGNFLAIVINY